MKMNALLRLVTGLTLLLASLNAYAQCAESIQVVNSNKILLTFDPAQDSIPNSITYGGQNYFISQSGTSDIYFIDNFLPGGTDLSVELLLNFDFVTQPCVYSAAGILDIAAPVELSFFQGRLHETDIQLQWTTQNEVDNAGFEIQRSFNGYDFITIDFVPGSGTTTLVSDYTYEDPDILNRARSSTVYYRLRQVDYDGKSSYSYILGIDLELDFAAFEITKIIRDRGNNQVLVYYHTATGTRKVEGIMSNIHGTWIERKVANPSPGVNEMTFAIPDKIPSQNIYIALSNGKQLLTEQLSIIRLD